MFYHLPLPISKYILELFPRFNMSISSVNYQETFLPKPDLTRILGIPTYYALQQIQLELKGKALYVQSNLVEGTHGYLRLLMTNKNYATLSPIPYVRPVYPGILQIPNNATRVTSYELKTVYNKNLQVFHEVRGVEQSNYPASRHSRQLKIHHLH